jgi:hypothetical protein
MFSMLRYLSKLMSSPWQMCSPSVPLLRKAFMEAPFNQSARSS